MRRCPSAAASRRPGRSKPSSPNWCAEREGLMHKRILVGAILIALGLHQSSAAQRVSPDARTVQGMYEMCKDPDGEGICIGYIAGVGETMRAIGVASKQTPELSPF